MKITTHFWGNFTSIKCSEKFLRPCKTTSLFSRHTQQSEMMLSCFSAVGYGKRPKKKLFFLWKGGGGARASPPGNVDAAFPLAFWNWKKTIAPKRRSTHNSARLSPEGTQSPIFLALAKTILDRYGTIGKRPSLRQYLNLFFNLFHYLKVMHERNRKASVTLGT